MNIKENNSFTLKIIAIVCMTINHIGHGFGAIMPTFAVVLTQIIGGFTFPIMAMLIIEGYRKTSNLRKYVSRLLICAAVSYIPWMYLFHVNFGFNIMFTLTLGLFALYLHERMKNKILFWFIFVVIDIITMLFSFDWGIIGLPLIMGYALVKSEKKRIIIPTIVVSVTMVALMALTYLAVTDEAQKVTAFTSMFFPLGSILCIPLLLSYNGERGPNLRWSKYLFYVYYPAHLIIIYILSQLIIK